MSVTMSVIPHSHVHWDFFEELEEQFGLLTIAALACPRHLSMVGVYKLGLLH